MGTRRASVIELWEQDRAYRESLVRDGRPPQRLIRRARILLALSDPATIVPEVTEKREQARHTIWYLCRLRKSVEWRRYLLHRTPAAPGRFPPLERVGMEQSTGCDPSGIGLQITPWSRRSLAQVAVQPGLVPQIAPSAVSLILRHADLPPPRSRSWQTPTLAEEFRRRSARLLWCYERAHTLAQQEQVVLCLEEKPNWQV
jgi:hypothetical protein